MDATFGGTGFVSTQAGSSNSEAKAIAIQSDGKIVVAGYDYYSDDQVFALARYNQDGSLDDSFGSSGIATVNFGIFEDTANAIAIQSDGKIVVAGYFFNGVENDLLLVRYNQDGSLDTSFGNLNNGKVIQNLVTGDDGANALAIQSDGKIVVAGYVTYGNKDFVLARFDQNGSLDTSFDGGTGRVITHINPSDTDEANAIAIQRDGKIIVVGYVNNGSANNFALVRYNPDGSPDISFGTNGIVTTSIVAGNSEAKAVAIQSDGKIVVIGCDSADFNFALARYNQNGSLDTSFGNMGIVVTSINPGSTDGAYAVALQPDGKIVAAGYTGNGTNNIFAIARYTTAGSLDPSFGLGRGIVTKDFGNFDDKATAIAIQSNGKLVVAGYCNSGTDVSPDYDFTIVRY